jgi:hypothetical protein
MKKNSKFNPEPSGSGQNFKLINFFILGFVFCSLTFLPVISEAAYKIYFKDGRLITGVSDVKEEDGKIRIYKSGIMLELPRASILKIEKYESELIEEEITEEKPPAEEEIPVEETLPEYLRYEGLSEEEIPEEPIEPIPLEEEPGETEGTERGKPQTTGTGGVEEGKLKPDAQLKELRRLEQEGTLPEQFKPYKDFLEKQYEQQKGHVEGE